LFVLKNEAGKEEDKNRAGQRKKKEKGGTKDYFYFFDFVKMSDKVRRVPEIKLNPCLYKKR
jgi:hypothetical protein